MSQLRGSFFIGDDTLKFTQYGNQLLLEGEIACQGGIIISVRKILEVTEDTLADCDYVHTVYYAYNVSIHGHSNLFRYDNADHYDDHQDTHHKHTFDWKTGDQIGDPLWIGAENWPTLREVIDEAHDWYCTNFVAFSGADEYPPIREY